MGFGSDNKKEYPHVVVFDLETGGFSPTKNPLIEFAAIVVDNTLKEVARKEWVILPYNDELEYTSGALQANGFTMGEINKRGIESSVVSKEIFEFLKSLKREKKIGVTFTPDSKPILCGHNIDKFDIPFLKEFLKQHKYDLDKVVSTKETIDTLKDARKYFGYKDFPYSNHQLGTCCKHIGFPIVDAHRAMNDVEGNLKLYRHFIESVRGTGTFEVKKQVSFRDTFKLSKS